MHDKMIPQNHMTIGQAAKKMGVTVRTLQYYDREGLLCPSARSEGGRRLYTGKDIVKLHQILSLKHLGFSLDDIKNRLIPLDTPGEVAQVLEEQGANIRGEIQRLTEALEELEALRAEVLQMQAVDFKKYADIIVNLRMKNEFYWLIKHFDEGMLDYIRNRFDWQSGTAFMENFLGLQSEAIRLQQSGLSPAGEAGQAFAKAYWDMIRTFTGGDMSLLPELMELGQSMDHNQEWKEKQALANAFIEPALEQYFSSQGLNPFQEEKE